MSGEGLETALFVTPVFAVQLGEVVARCKSHLSSLWQILVSALYYPSMASDYAWGFVTSREIKSWSPDPAPNSNCEDQLDDDWDVASLPQLSFKPLPFVHVSTQVKWTVLAGWKSQEADKLKITNTEQNVHEPFLCYSPHFRPAHSFSTVSVRSDPDSKGYVQVWLSQPGNANLFGVRLIGDAKAPHLSSSMAPADLALYSEWGMSRMQQHMDTKPLELVLLVLTDPAILKEAILGLHSGVMSLSWHTAEASCYGRFHWSECPYCQPQQASIAKYIFNMLSACSSAFWRLLVRIISVTKAQDCLFLCCQLPSELIILA